ncbi:MAG TPA: flagellar hook assembly protein FlgD [Rhizobiaceae bacterium]|nr:flagellar hook assembly protein FlgD [Rhizobiaceae bacterium]
MYVNTTTAAGTSAAQAGSSAGTANVDYQSFLRLLVAQMKNQDPTKPMESTEYVAQLATFSQVEQSVQMNAKLDQMLRASSMSQADALIGREITSADGNTTGVVDEVRLTSTGLIAVLADGKEVPVVEGVTIRAATA